MTARNPVKDQVAIVGVGSTGFTRTSDRSALALGLDAATQAIRDAGLRACDVDGVVAVAEPGAPSPQLLASSLGLAAVKHWTRPSPVILFAVVDAVNAIFAGTADTVLVVAPMLRTPITLADHAEARMIREPLCLLDMDLPVDGADAFVLTSAERAKAMPHPPVLVHATATGMVGENTEDQLGSLARHGQHVVVEQLKAKSDLWLDDVDVYCPYDGFTIITAAWLENTGWCAPGEAVRFLREHWVDEEHRVLIRGRVPINPHGGSLAEGGTRGTGHLREAVVQLRGAAGARQVAGARTALVTPGGFFFNSQGAVLRRA